MIVKEFYERLTTDAEIFLLCTKTSETYNSYKNLNAISNDSELWNKEIIMVSVDDDALILEVNIDE